MSEAPRRINTERSLNRPTEKRPAEAPASKTSLNGQPDFFQPEEPAAPQELPKAKARPEPDTRQELGLKMPAASSGGTGGNGGGNLPPKHAAPQGSGGRRRKKKKKTPLWLPLAVTLAVVALLSGVVVYAASMVTKVEDNLKPEEDAPSITQEIQTLEEYKGDVVNILVCGIDYEEGRNYSDSSSNDGMTDMILYCQFDIKGGALRMLQIPRNSLVATTSRKVTLSNGKTYAASNYQINSVALSNNGSIAALAEVIYDQYKLPIDYYVTIDMQALVEMVDNFGGIEVYIPHDMSFAGSALKQGYRNLDGASAEFFVRCRHGEGYSNSDIDRLNMQRYFYAGLFKRVRSMGITDVHQPAAAGLQQLYPHRYGPDHHCQDAGVLYPHRQRQHHAGPDALCSWACPTWARPSSFDGYSCVVPDAGSIAELLNTYFRNYTGPVSAERNEPCDQQLAPRHGFHQRQRPVRRTAGQGVRRCHPERRYRCGGCDHHRRPGRGTVIKPERRLLWKTRSTARPLPLRSQRSWIRKRPRMSACSKWRA